jgi:type I restriction enzyme M protein
MNAMLHDLHAPIVIGDTLSSKGKSFSDYDVVLTNPPFGTKKGGERPTRDDLTFPSSNKQLNFLQLIYRSLKADGKARAAVVLPDNVLFAEGDGRQVRADLMDKCNLHTVLRLPTGIFYAQGVKTNVLFFTRGKTDKGNTKEVWVYDLRTGAPSFGKRTALTEEYFAPFEKAYGKDPHGKSRRKADDRFKCFTREEIQARKDNLDILWLQENGNSDNEQMPEPDQIAAEIMAHLDGAMKEMKALSKAFRSRVHVNE